MDLRRGGPTVRIRHGVEVRGGNNAQGRSGPSDPDKGRSRHKGGFGGRREPTVRIHKEVIQRRLRVLAVRMGPKEVLTAKEESREVLATRVNLREVLAAKRRC